MLAVLDTSAVVAAVALLTPVAVAVVVVIREVLRQRKRRRLHRELYAIGALSPAEIQDLGRLLQPGERAR